MTRRHPAWDLVMIVFACALIGTAFGSTIVFCIACAIMLVCYVLGNIQSSSEPKEEE